jgi:hypothetical protein
MCAVHWFVVEDVVEFLDDLRGAQGLVKGHEGLLEGLLVVTLLEAEVVFDVVGEAQGAVLGHLETAVAIEHGEQRHLLLLIEFR